MKCMTLKPDGWTCTLAECPPGFFVFQDDLYLKTEYSATLNSVEGEPEAYCSSGEVFWGGAKGVNGVETCKIRRQLVVQPVLVHWQELHY